MNDTIIDLRKLPQWLFIGYATDNAARPQVFDFSSWVEEYGSGTLELNLQRPGDEVPYPVTLSIEGTTATWTPSSEDTKAKGQGMAQFVYTVGGTVAHTAILRVLIGGSLGAGEDAPNGFENWFQKMQVLAAAAADSADASAASADSAEESAETAAEILEDVGTAGAEQIQAIGEAGTAQITAVGEAGAAQVQAVQEKGEEVLESIPEDYSDLSADVVELKSSLNGGTFTFTKTYMSDNRYSTNVIYNAEDTNIGKNLANIFSAQTTGAFAYMLDVTLSKSVKVPVGTSTQTVYGFLAFDSNDICVWVWRNLSGHAAGDVVEFSLPINATKMLCVFNKSLNNLGTEYVVTLDTSSVISEIINNSETSEKFTELVLNNEQENLFVVNEALGGYLTYAGKHTTDQAAINRTTPYILINSNKQITIQTWWSDMPSDVTQWQAFCFYDENKELVGLRNVKTSTGTYQSYTITVPEGAVYFRAASRVYYDWHIMLQYGATPVAFRYSEKDTGYLLNDVSAITKNSDDVYIKSINHRGWYECPENTLPAFIQSKKHGYNYVETDIRFTADGTPVLMHDATINRTCCNASDGSAITETVNIEDIHDSELSNYDACTPSAWSKWAGTKIPTFAEFIDLCRKLGLKMYIEIKAGDQDKISSLVSMVKGNGSIKNASWICAAVANIQYLQNTDNALRIGLVTNIVDSVIIQTVNSIKAANEGEVFIDSSSYGSEQVTLCSDAEIPLEAWTVDTQTAVLALNNYVTGITTNRVIASSILYDSVIE